MAGVDGRWVVVVVVVRQQVPAYAGLHINVPDWLYNGVGSGVYRARHQGLLSGRRDGSNNWSKSGVLRDRGVAKNVGLGRWRKLLNTVVTLTP